MHAPRARNFCGTSSGSKCAWCRWHMRPQCIGRTFCVRLAPYRIDCNCPHKQLPAPKTATRTRKKKASMHAMAGHCTCKGCKAQWDLCTILGPMHLLTSLVYVRLNMTPNIFLRVRIPLALPGPIAEHASRVLPGPLGATVCTRPLVAAS